MSRGRLAVAALGLGLAGAAGLPAVTAIGPLRRTLAPRLAGIASGSHIALTYDDGPDPDSTPAFLDLLAQHERRATFFVLGAQAADHPDVIRRIAGEGHELAIHGWTHRLTTLIPPGRLAPELRRARQVVEDITGATARWYRPPYGVFSADAHRACRGAGLTPVLWSAWGREWEGSATPERIVRSVERTLRPGGTILLHDTDCHAPHGDWRKTHDASGRLFRGPLADADVGPLADHW
jgi:peptidoglycan/xylan/chitin deacetylase (PgdA/CDA1 family)